MPTKSALPVRNFCSSCAEGKHQCTGVVRVFTLNSKAEPACTTKEVPCECHRCREQSEEEK